MFTRRGGGQTRRWTPTREWAVSQLAARCATAEKCSADILQRCAEWGMPEDEAVTVLDELQRLGFVDDARYARAYVSDKCRFDHWGPLKIRAHLRPKQLPTQVVEEAFNAVDKEQWTEALEEALRSKMRLLKPDLPPEKRREALLRFALSRGFDPHCAIEALDRLQDDDD